MPEELDPRDGLPSASAFARYAACPPSFSLSRGVRGEASNISRAGDRVHKWLQFDGKENIKLQDADEMWCAQRCLDERLMLMELVHGGDEVTEIREVRLWDRRDRFSGVPDYVAISDGHALVVDYKAGPIAVEHSSKNKQLMALAVLVSYNFKVNKVTVATIQPKCGKPIIHCYTKTKLASARRHISRILKRMKNPALKPSPGPKQCRYCNAKPICPALKKETDDLMMVHPEALTPARVSKVLEQAKVVKELISAIETRAKMMISEKPDSIPGWYLKDGTIRRTIPNSRRAYSKLADGGLPFDLVLGSATFSPSKLERMYIAHMKETGNPASTREARECIRELLGGELLEKQSEPRLCAVGE